MTAPPARGRKQQGGNWEEIMPYLTPEIRENVALKNGVQTGFLNHNGRDAGGSGGSSRHPTTCKVVGSHRRALPDLMKKSPTRFGYVYINLFIFQGEPPFLEHDQMLCPTWVHV